MYRVNVYARCTAIKMTGGLSYCLYIVAAISLHIAPSLTAVHYDSSNLTDITESRQFRHNMDVSKYKDKPHWLENYRHKPLKHHKVEKRPFWESHVVAGPWTNDQKVKEVENWEEMMRKVTDERLKKWSSFGPKEPVDEDKSKTNVNNTSHDRPHQTDPDEDVPENSENIDLEHASTSSSEDLENSEPTEKSIVDLSKKDELLGESVLPYRWGMSMNRPPDDVIKQIMKNDIHKLHKNKKVSQEKEADDDDDTGEDMSARFSPHIADDELSERSSSRSKRKRKHPLKRLHSTKIDHTERPKLLSIIIPTAPPEAVDSPKNDLDINEQNPHEINAIYDTGIETADEKSRIFAPILVLGPTIYISDLPKTIKQKLKIHRPLNLWNRIQSIQSVRATNVNDIPAKKCNQSGDCDFSGTYEFY